MEMKMKMTILFILVNKNLSAITVIKENHDLGYIKWFVKNTHIHFDCKEQINSFMT